MADRIDVDIWCLLAYESLGKYRDNLAVHHLAKCLLRACLALKDSEKERERGRERREYRAICFGHEPEPLRDLRLEKLRAFLKYFKITEGDVRRSSYDSIEDLFEDLADCETEEQFDEAIRFYIELRKRDFDYYKRKDAVAVENRVRRERLAKEAGTHTEREWMILCALCKFACARCGGKGKLTKDHVIPLYYEGQSSDAIANIQPLCLSCNCAKAGDMTDYVSKEIRESMARGIF